jgi:opacity protein-like surface antigen
MWTMKRLTVSTLALAFGLVAFAGDAEAQVPGRAFEFGISGGPSIAVGDLGGEANTGYHVQGSLGFGMAGLPLNLRADAFWQEFPEAAHAGEWIRQVGGLVNGIFGLPLGMAQPYGLVGAGVLSTTEHGRSETSVGFNAGAGVRFPFVGMSGVIEARFLNLFGGEGATGVQSIPISFGIRF